MKLSEILRLVWINLIQNKFKVVLTSIGIVVGAATIVMVIAIGRGGQMDVADQFKNLNAGAIDISYEQSSDSSSSNSKSSSKSGSSGKSSNGNSESGNRGQGGFGGGQGMPQMPGGASGDPGNSKAAAVQVEIQRIVEIHPQINHKKETVRQTAVECRRCKAAEKCRGAGCPAALVDLCRAVKAVKAQR